MVGQDLLRVREDHAAAEDPDWDTMLLMQLPQQHLTCPLGAPVPVSISPPLSLPCNTSSLVPIKSSQPRHEASDQPGHCIAAPHGLHYGKNPASHPTHDLLLLCCCKSVKHSESTNLAASSTFALVGCGVVRGLHPMA